MCKLGTDDTILWPTMDIGRARQEKIVPSVQSVGVIAVLMRKESVLSLYIGTGVFP